MDAKELVDQLLHAAKEYAEKGQAIAEDKLDIPSEGEARKAKLDGIKNGAIIAGAAALLLGTKTGRSVTGTAIKLGSLAAVGGLAYQTYQSWKNNNDDKDTSQTASLESKANTPDSAKSLILLKSIISAAKADGHISDSELKTIHTELSKLELDLDINHLIQNTPSDPEAIATLVDNTEFAAEVYLISSLVIDQSNDAAKAYLDALVTALHLPKELIQALNSIE